MNDSVDLKRAERDATHARRTSRTLLALLVGGGLALALVLGGTIYWHRLHALPEVTEETYREARTLWETNAPPSYELTVELSGQWSDTYHVVVQEGDVAEVLFNGMPLTNSRTQDVWTGTGMLRTIGEDLARCARQEKAAELPPEERDALPEPHLTVRARFDEKYGYPAEYLRIELGGQTNVSWVVTRFEVVEDTPPLDPPADENDATAGE